MIVLLQQGIVTERLRDEAIWKVRLLDVILTRNPACRISLEMLLGSRPVYQAVRIYEDRLSRIVGFCYR